MHLVDANVLIDVFTADEHWFDWSSGALVDAAERGPLGVNQIIYAEISAAFRSVAQLDRALDELDVTRLSLPFEAGPGACRAFLEYRKRGGTKRSPLPDFHIGSHALIAGYSLVTRDAARYRTYFPELTLVCP